MYFIGDYFAMRDIVWSKWFIPLDFIILLVSYPSCCIPMRPVPHLVPQIFGHISIVGFTSNG